MIQQHIEAGENGENGEDPEEIIYEPPTGFFRRFLHLAGPYFKSDERWMARALLIGTIALTLIQVGIQVRINVWNRDFFNALEQRDWHVFIGQMGMFALLVSAAMGIAVYQAYVKQLLQLRWRR